MIKYNLKENIETQKNLMGQNIPVNTETDTDAMPVITITNYFKKTNTLPNGFKVMVLDYHLMSYYAFRRDCYYDPKFLRKLKFYR